jgi:hypothetical protein
MAGKLTKPLLGLFAGVTPTGYIWFDTISFRARDARVATGRMMEGRRLKDGRTIDNAAAGWALAKSEGFRIERVDVLPAGRQALGAQP